MTDSARSTGKPELLTAVITALNEESNIRATVEDIYRTKDRLPVDLHVLMFDDGSTDDTPSIMRKLAEEYPDCRCVINPKNLGVGRSMLLSYDMIDPDSWITGIPGDNEFFFESIFEFLEIREHYDIVLGYHRNPVVRPIVRRVASQSFSQVCRFLYGLDFKYLNGMKMYKAHVFQGIEVTSNGHAYTPELVAKAILRNPRIRIGEAPFMTRGRAHGRSSAFRIGGVGEAVVETFRGARSVASFRDRMILDKQIESI